METQAIAPQCDVGDPFEVTREKPKAGKASKVIEVRFDDDLLDNYLYDHRQMDDYEARVKLGAAEIKRRAEAARLETSLVKRAVVQSLLLAGRLTFTAKKVFGKIDMSAGEDLARAFNGHFSTYFGTEKETELDIAALVMQRNDPAVVAAFQLLNKRGALIQKKWYAPTDIFFQDYTLDEGVRGLAQARGIVPQMSLSVPKNVSADGSKVIELLMRDAG